MLSEEMIYYNPLKQDSCCLIFLRALYPMTIPQQKNSCPGGKVCSGHTVDGGDSDKQGLRGKGRM